jgi:hypothetical protein
MADSFGKYCSSLMGQYNDNMKRLVEDSTEMIFNLVLKNPNLQVRSVINGQINIGKFYLIQYNYNGNKLWCHIFVIDDRYSTELQKRIIYSVNLDYLPYQYKIVYFDKLFKMFSSIIERNKINNDGGNTVNEEIPMKVNFESVYKSLKNNGGFSYAITAFDYTKIVGIGEGGPKIFGISTTILNRFIFIDTRIINKRIMMDVLKDSDVEKEKETLKKLLLAYEKTAFDYENDVKEYYQQLKLLENHYKIYENPK